jgi:hypothetical protein
MMTSTEEFHKNLTWIKARLILLNGIKPKNEVTHV